MDINDRFKDYKRIVIKVGTSTITYPKDVYKRQDIGCSMGKTGTDTAKAAADMIIADDNFSTIVCAVREGRIIYKNIKKAVHFLLSSNVGEILTVFTAMVFGWSTPLLPIHLLWINFITDSLPVSYTHLDVYKRQSTYYMREQWVNLVKGLMCLLFVVDTIVLTSFVTCMSRQIKKKQLFSNTFIAATVRFIASFIKYSNIRMWTILCLILFAVANAILGGFAYASESFIPVSYTHLDVYKRQYQRHAEA